MAKCKDCINYKLNPEFDYYDSSKGGYADCEMNYYEFTDICGVLQETLGHEIDCEYYKLGGGCSE